MTIRLSGMTWDHARAHPPLERTAAEFRASSGVEVTWYARSLYDFGMQPLAELARQHDLLVVDYPHVGQAAESGDLIALDDVLAMEDIATLAQESVGASHSSYTYAGRQWALALDAAAQVAVWRPDLIEQPPATWAEAVELAGDGRVLFPACPTDAFASFLTLAANYGTTAGASNAEFIERASGVTILHKLLALVDRIDSACLELNPIAVLERLAHPGSREAYCPLLFGYSNYSRGGYRPCRLRFGNFARASPGEPGGSLLGGAGLAVSAFSAHPREAALYALFTCGAATQSGSYLESGGQPANRTAWEEPGANELVGDFFAGTRETMEHAWVRPRHAGWLEVQDAGMRLVHAFLRRRQGAEQVLDELDATWLANVPGT